MRVAEKKFLEGKGEGRGTTRGEGVQVGDHRTSVVTGVTGVSPEGREDRE